MILTLKEFIIKETAIYERIKKQLVDTHQTESARYKEVCGYLTALNETNYYFLES